MEGQTKTNILNTETWIRLLYMIVFVLLSFVARIVVWVVAVLQFLLVLITGEGNPNLRDLGQGTSKWTYQAFLFLTFNSDDKPFPFADWPKIEPEAIATGEMPVSDENANIDDVPTFVDSETGVEAETEVVVETTDPDVDSSSETKTEKSE